LLSSENEELKTANFQHEVDLDDFRKQKLETDNYIHNLEEEISILKIEKGELIEKNDDLISKVGKLETLQNEEWDRLEKKVTHTLDSLKEARDENLLLQEKLTEYENVEMEYEENRQELRQKYVRKKEENRILHEQVGKLEEELGDLEDKFE
jgi:chromosome segregation ATPase